ncbi:MAG: hypothetical protein L6420_08870 [Elusimicrobia bacterium]|nr:hypothetical protein [Elusimicrobiota bacterium]
MKRNALKYSVYGLCAIICLALAFIFMHFSREKKQNYRVGYAVKIAEKILFESKKSMENAQDFGRKFEFVETSAAVYSHGAISIVKDSNFEGVNEPPKSMMQKLQDMAKSKRDKFDPIALTEQDFKKKIFISTDVLKQSIKSSKVPGMGNDDLQADSKITMIKAPVDYKLFTGAKTWEAFASSHKGDFPVIDFTKKNAVILVSLSDFPSGIFKIADTIKTPKEIIIKYRVNPLIMAVNNEPDKHNYYTAAVISKSDLPIRLVQVP